MNVIDLIKLIEIRPVMMISNSSISCLKSFIDGWAFQNQNSDLDLRMEILNDFGEWLQEAYNLDNSRGWEKIVLFYSLDETDALKNFFDYFNDFLKAKGFK